MLSGENPLSASHCLLPTASHSANVRRTHLLAKHRGIAHRLLVEHEKHCAEVAAACMVKFQGVLSWLQRKPKDIEEVTAHTVCFDCFLHVDDWRGVLNFNHSMYPGAVPIRPHTCSRTLPVLIRTKH